MPKSNNKNADEEQYSSDDNSYDNDDIESHEKEHENDRSYSGSDDDKYSDGGSDDRSNGRNSDSDGDDDDDYSDDYERGENSEEFDDEEMSQNGKKARYVVNQQYAEDGDGDTKNDEYWWEGKETLIAAILLCWCCLCLIIIGVVLGVVLGGRNRNKTDISDEILPDPTNRPTFAPQPLPPSTFTSSPTESAQPTITVTIAPTIRPTARPTTSPTLSFVPTKGVPEKLEIFADQDTYVQHNVSKEFHGEEYGLLDTFLVQNGPLKCEDLPDSRGLVTFPIKDVPDFSRINGMEKSAILRLTHVISEDGQHPSANYTIIRVPETKSAVEYFHGYYFKPPEDNATGVLVGPAFPVGPNDTVIDIDISQLLYNYTLEDNKKAKQLFLMIENRGPDQFEGGDRFWSRESKSPPELLLNFN